MLISNRSLIIDYFDVNNSDKKNILIPVGGARDVCARDRTNAEKFGRKQNLFQSLSENLLLVSQHANVSRNR